MSEFFVKLKNRGLIHIEGEDRKSFLQGLITNDINKLTQDAPLYACLLTAQGKFLHDFFVIEDGDAILLDCEGGDRTKDLHKRLSMYRLRADVELSIQEENTVYAILSSCDLIAGSQDEQKDPAVKPQDDTWWPDTRHPDMGYRSFEKPDLPEKPFEDWDYHRIFLCVPDGSRDLIPEKSTMDEGSMDQLNAIDYEKGCYVGQELTARMHYRGLGKKRLKTISLTRHPERSEQAKPVNAVEGSKNNKEDLSTAEPSLHSASSAQDDTIVDTRSTCRGIGIALVRV